MKFNLILLATISIGLYPAAYSVQSGGLRDWGEEPPMDYDPTKADQERLKLQKCRSS